MLTGKSHVCCLYPNQNSELTLSVENAFGSSTSENSGSSTVMNATSLLIYMLSVLQFFTLMFVLNVKVLRLEVRQLIATLSVSQADEDKTLHFILLDGTWNNSAAMLKRLKV